jgi:hypothetical protein
VANVDVNLGGEAFEADGSGQTLVGRTLVGIEPSSENNPIAINAESGSIKLFIDLFRYHLDSIVIQLSIRDELSRSMFSGESLRVKRCSAEGSYVAIDPHNDFELFKNGQFVQEAFEGLSRLESHIFLSPGHV